MNPARKPAAFPAPISKAPSPTVAAARWTIILVASLVAILPFVTGCNDDSPGKPGGDDYNPVIDPDSFVTVIDNPFLTLAPGTTYVYEADSDGESEGNEVAVTHDTKVILGVTCVVVWDRVWVDDELAEATYDWYAQDTDGNVWYFGEDSKEYQDGVVVSTEGSWEAGVDDAKPGIVMKAHPAVGDSYRQEYYEDEAEDMAKVLSLTEAVTIGLGTYENCLKTKEWTPLEPGVSEHKYYAPGVGLILEEVATGGEGRNELVEIVTE